MSKEDPRKVKDMGLKQFKEDYAKANRSECPPSEVRKFEKMYEKDILPRVYEGK